MLLYIAAALVLLLGIALAFGVGLIATLPAVAAIVIRILLLLLAAAGAAWLVVLARKRSAGAGKTADGKPVDTAAFDDLLREANRKLAASPRAGAKRLNDLPLLYILGDANSAKTTVVLKSGLEPELLSGQVYRERDVVSTPVANIWYSEKAALIEAGDAFRTTPTLWNRLIVRTRPEAYRAAFKGAQFRAAVLCVSCEQFMGAQTNETMQASAALHGAQLREMARLLGTALPTYVLLTKLDRVPGFTDFVRNLSAEEGHALLGASPDISADGGSYAEQATSATTRAYDDLLFSLGEARLEVLFRETDPARLGPAYEFPRELRRFRTLLSTYLVELVRPSHLDSNPMLRGFYFTGIRAIVQQQMAAAAAPLQAGRPLAADATGIFSVPQASAAVPLVQPAVFGEKVAQWTFLSRFFPDAVLGDTAALMGTRQTGHGRLFRRLLYGSIAALLLIYLGLLTGSYFANAALEQHIESASTSLAAVPSSSSGLVSVEQLRLLDDLRSDVVHLEAYRQNGVPLRYRWGLYRGDQILQPARAAYFAHFRTLLLNRTQQQIVMALSGLPATPPQVLGANTDYNTVYSGLRAYLITTSNPDRSTVDFLPPVLVQHLQQTGALSGDTEQQQLAQRQFAYYASVLPHDNPYSIAPSGQAVTHARGYLSGFGGFERIYQTILTAADKSGPSIQFNEQHPGSIDTVVEPHTIAAAFTQPGYSFVQDAIAHPDRYFSGEAWVLGDQAPASIEPGALRSQLATRYVDDYISKWRAFLKDATVVRYRTLADAGDKLTALSSNSSPLLALIYTASRNTSVPNPQIAAAFQAPQALVPGGSTEQYIGTPNKAYVDALLALTGAIRQVTQSNPSGPADPAAAAPVSTAASAAHMAAQQAAQAFHIDSQAHVDTATLALLEAPITGAEGLVRGMGPTQANAGGKSFCTAYNGVFGKSPFNPKATAQATPAEITALLQPGTGSLWQFYNANLKAVLVQQGPEYVLAPTATVKITPAFLRFFNRAATISTAMFPAGATAPVLNFTMRTLPASGVQSSQFRVDAQTLNNSEAQKQFTWSAQNAAQAGLTANTLPLTFSGTWAVFELLNKAHTQKTPAGYELSFPLELANTPVKAPDGTPVVVRYELSGPGADVLAPGALAGLRCVSEVAQ